MSSFKRDGSANASRRREDRSATIERLRRRRLSWGDRMFDDSAVIIRQMRDERIIGDDARSVDGAAACGSFPGPMDAAE